MTFSASDVFKYALKNGIMDYDDALESMIFKNLKEKVIEVHKYSVSIGSDGRWRTNIYDKSGLRKTIRKKMERELYLYLADFYEIPHEERKYTLATLYPEWLEYKRLHTTAKTYIFRIDSEWKRYYKDDPIVQIPIHKLDRLQLDEWAHRLIIENRMSKNAYYNTTVIIRQCLQYAVDRGMLERNVFNDIHVDGRRMFRKVRKKPDQQQVFSTKELSAIHDMAWNDFHNRKKGNPLGPLCVIFQMLTGMRVGEVVCVKYSDLERTNYIHVQRMVRRDTHEIVDHTKTDCGDRFVLITSEARKIIEVCKATQEDRGAHTEFIFSITEKPVSIWTIRDLYQKYSKALGIWKMSHTSRRTYISALLDGGVNLNTVRTMAGHSSEKTTLQNYVFDRGTELEKLEKLERALQFSSP